MTTVSAIRHSYRDDPAVPRFDDSRPLFVFDGHCGLCSGGVRWLMRADRRRRIAFTSAQGPLGRALYQHYRLEIDATYLLIDRGEAFGLSQGYFRLLPYLGGLWRAGRVIALVPETLRDAVYRTIARNRYRWFGRHDHCALLTEDQRARLL
jgi:predicted DCC family thiol-disulfide oxidoreductase YuxK